MIKLLQVNINSNSGSTGKIAEAIGHLAINKGWNSYIAYGRKSSNSISKEIKIGSKLDTYIHYIFNHFFDMEGRCSNLATRKLIKQIQSIKPNIIQLHNIHDHYLNYKILFEYLNKTNIKIVWTFHDCWAFTGHCYHFIDKNCMKWKNECYNCIKRNKYIDKSHENFLLKKTLFTGNDNITIVSCSHWIGGFVKESFFKDKNLKVIHNGVDLSTFRIIPNVRKRDGKFRIIAVSNVWLKYKGIYDIFELRKILPSEYEFTIVGVNKKQLKTLPQGIRGIQKTQNIQELVHLYNESDVLINPTYADTFPTVNLESLACGTPVITYNTGGSPEAINENTGVVVEQGNIQKLAIAIKSLKENPLSREVCRSHAEKYFDKDKCFDKYIKLYESLL